MKTQFFAVQQVGRTADIYIFGDIVVYECFDGDVSAAGLVAQIRGLEADEINVYIDSYGGAVSEGWAIYQALRQHPAKVNTYGMGFVASAAVFPFLAGENRYAMSTSAYYLHQVAVEVYGNADVLRAAANEVEMMTDVGIAAFTETTSLDADTVKRMMQEEVWLSPAQVLELGIATAINADKAPRYMQNAKKQIFSRLFAQSMQQCVSSETAPTCSDAGEPTEPGKPVQENDTPEPPTAPTVPDVQDIPEVPPAQDAPPPQPEQNQVTPPHSILQMLAGIFME